MQKSSSNTPKPGFSVQDALFVVFKHKWMILVLSLLGLGAAAFVFKSREPLYLSQAKLYVSYVLQRGTVDDYEAQSSPGPPRVNSVINTEIEILTSVDLALDVADKIGVETLLPESGGNAPVSAAAGQVLSELSVGVGQSPNVLVLTYGNKDPELSKTVLQELVERYFEKHLSIHRSASTFTLVEEQAKEVKARLEATEKELNELRSQSGIVSMADATSALSAQSARTRQALMEAKAMYAEQEATVLAMERAAGANEPEANIAPANEIAAPPPDQVVTEYRTVMELLSFLQKRDVELKLKFRTGNRLLTLNQGQIEGYEARRRELIRQYPNLVEQAAVDEKGEGGPTNDLFTQKSRLAAISAKIQVYETHLEEISKQFSEQYAIGAKIEELDRRKQMEETELLSLDAKFKAAKLDNDLDPSRMPNIRIIQHPSEPIKAYDEKTNKLILGLAGSGLAIGLGIAFLIELLLDRRVKRPMEIQTRLQLPLLLTIPFIRRKERGGFMLSHDPEQARIGMADDGLIPANGMDELAMENQTSKVGHFILPYSETIRDRIIFNFEVNNVTHKPKLVAVTGLSEGAGASTVAAGLAKSFSEINGAKVLLVDLSSCHPEDSPLFGELPRHSLNGALHLARGNKFRDSKQNLFYASANARRDETGLTTFSPVHLYELMPHLQASEYDYIIFDMPPLDQTSRTLTMAGLMDKVLLVLDAENTSRDGLMWGYSELVKGRADVSCIFNKTRSHVPGWLIGDN